MKEYLTNIYVKHNTKSKTYQELSADMERDFFMSAQEAVDYGLADRIIDKRG
jgi:ATP-dependent Clp protease protease subunit